MTFRYNPRFAGGVFLAEPVLLPEGFRRIPVVPLDGKVLFFPSRFQGSIAPVQRMATLRAEVAYRQATVPAEGDKIYSAGAIQPEYLHELTTQPVGEIRQWTHELARKLAGQIEPPLTEDDRDRIETERGVGRERQEAVARALCAYFARSGEYSYSLEQPRSDTTIDPTVDFLRNVKEGHCERLCHGPGADAAVGADPRPRRERLPWSRESGRRTL